MELRQTLEIQFEEPKENTKIEEKQVGSISQDLDYFLKLPRTMEVKIENGKIYAPLKEQWLVDKPEERVRQQYICRLVDTYGYELNQMEQEKQVNNSHRGQGAARADIVVWKTAQDKNNEKNALQCCLYPKSNSESIDRRCRG